MNGRQARRRRCITDYRALGARGVLASRVALCDASDRAPFFDLCLLGSGSDLRGYQVGRYRDHFMLTGQMEYRLSLSRRFGAVVFAGAGGVSSGFDSLGDSPLLPSVGTGFRFLAAPSQGINISVDYAWGRKSGGLYVYIGDAF